MSKEARKAHNHKPNKLFIFWQRWLVVVSIVILVFGLLMTFTSGTPFFNIFHRWIDPAFWAGQTPDASARNFQAWVYGVWGTTLAGWGVLLTYIAVIPFKKREKWAWNCMAAGILTWFLLDTGLSLIHGVNFNVAVNCMILILAGLPLVFTRKLFLK